jgi:hypothetical protein
MTTPDLDTAVTPWPIRPDGEAVTADRVADLLMRLEAAAPRPLVLRPMADLRPAHDGTGVFVFATVFIDAGDGRGARSHALHEVQLAAACLADDPPFPAAPSLAPRLALAAVQAADAAQRLSRSLA